MRKIIGSFVADRRGVVPIEYLHVVILVTAVIVTAINFIFN